MRDAEIVELALRRVAEMRDCDITSPSDDEQRAGTCRRAGRAETVESQTMTLYPSGLLRDHPKMRTPLTADQIREVELRQWDVYWKYWRPASLLSFADAPRASVPTDPTRENKPASLL